MAQAKLKGSDQTYRVGKIVCIGRNYADHIAELGNTVPSQPVIFIKPATSILTEGGNIEIPDFSSDCHHEVELAVLIGKQGKNIAPKQVSDHIAGYGVAIDLTLRDVQSELKGKGLPWEIAKGFDTACPLSDFTPTDQITDAGNLQLKLWVNDELRQDGNSNLMLRTLPELIRYISGIFTLEAGDIILSGTPAGVGPIRSGDQLRAEIEQVGELKVSVG